MPSIRFVIPTKNEEALLPRLLQSLKEQTMHTEMRIVVADAKSTDATRSIAKSFGAEVVPGGMPGAGRNAGAKGATEEWLWFVDADSYLPEATMVEQVLAACAKKGADFATCRVVEDTPSWRGAFLHGAFAWYSEFTQESFPRVPGACFLVKRTWFERVGGFDERVVFAEDMDLAERLSKQGAVFVYLGTIPIHTSLRRYKRDGYFRTGVRCLRAELYMRANGPITKELFPYGFDYRD